MGKKRKSTRQHRNLYLCSHLNIVVLYSSFLIIIELRHLITEVQILSVLFPHFHHRRNRKIPTIFTIFSIGFFRSKSSVIVFSLIGNRLICIDLSQSIKEKTCEIININKSIKQRIEFIKYQFNKTVD